jgi:hypothetical protein
MPEASQIYKFNSSSDIATHSTGLTNQRIAWMFLKLDAASMDMNGWYRPGDIEETYSTLNQIWKNVRCFFSNHPHPRIVLKMDTKIPGTYTIDLAMSTAKRQIYQCQMNGWTHRKCYIISNILNQAEEMLRAALQYFSYFIKSQERQKPELSDAAEAWKDKADAMTVTKLKDYVGKNNKIDWDLIGDSMINPDDLDIDTDLEDYDDGENITQDN